MRPQPILAVVLLLLGVGYLIADARLILEWVRYRRRQRGALLVWTAKKPPYWGLSLAIGVTLGVLVFYKIVFIHQQAFGETMMFLYYAYVVPLSRRIGRGFYEDGIWSDGGFMPYSHIGGLTWREGDQITLVLMHRVRAFARRLTVPERYYGAARRLLRDKIAAHDIHFTGKSLDLGLHDERDDV